MNIRLLFVLLALLSLSAASFVEDINDSHLEDIKKSRKIWMVYTPEGETDNNVRVLHDVSLILSGFFKIGVLPPGSPALHLYTDNGEIIPYSGKFQVDDLVNFALDNTEAVIKARSKVADEVKAHNDFKQKEKERAAKEWADEQALRQKSDTLVLNNENWQSAFLKQRDPCFINIYEANCSACIELNKEWELVSTALKGKAIVAKINVTESYELEDGFRVEKYPAVRYYAAGMKKLDQFSQFEGILKKFSFLDWANERMTQKKSLTSIPELNKENYQTMCKETKATCVILFVDNPAEIEAQTGKLAAKYLQKPITFLVSKKGSQPNFENQVGVEESPDTVMMYCKMKKMMRMGGMDFNSIDEVINEITLGNRNNFVKYKFSEEIQ